MLLYNTIAQGQVLVVHTSKTKGATPGHPNVVILSGAGSSRSEVPAESKDPYTSLRAANASGNSPRALDLAEGQLAVNRRLVEPPEDWFVWSGHSCPLPLTLIFGSHHLTGEEGVVEIESHWTATRRENQGIHPTVRRRDME